MSHSADRVSSTASTDDAGLEGAVDAPLSRTAPSAARALRVLETLAAAAPRGYTLAELRRRLGYSHGNMHAILGTMEAAGHVRRDPETRAYTLGPALLAIGEGARQTYPSVERAMPFMRELADDLATECCAGVRVGNEVLVVARVGPAPPSGFGVTVGERLPLTPPIGTMYIAWLGDDEIDTYLRQGAAYLSVEELERHRSVIEGVRRRGYSILVDSGPRQRLGETATRIVVEASRRGYDDELRTLAHELAHQEYVLMDPSDVDVGHVIDISSPVFGPSGAVELVIGVAFVAPQYASRPLVEVVDRLMTTTRTVTRAIGGRLPLGLH